MLNPADFFVIGIEQETDLRTMTVRFTHTMQLKGCGNVVGKTYYVRKEVNQFLWQEADLKRQLGIKDSLEKHATHEFLPIITRHMDMIEVDMEKRKVSMSPKHYGTGVLDHKAGLVHIDYA